ncbi:PREP1, partial [Symbiodinium sp. CCMP2456]
MPVDDPWPDFLANLKHDLEKLPKFQRAQTAYHLLRWIDYRATDREAGYFLGHMQGRTADITALLVVAFGDSGFQESDFLGHWPNGWVLGLRETIGRYIPCHEGSRQSWGESMQPGMPVIMLHSSVPPTNTPESSPIDVDVTDAGECNQGRRGNRKRSVTVELSSGSGDAPRVTRRVSLPMTGSRASFQLDIQVEEDNESEASTTVITGARERPDATLWPGAPSHFRLPEPAPGDLQRAGISMTDLLGMWAGWKSGSLTSNEIQRVYGPAVAAFVRTHWGTLPPEAYYLLPETTDRTEHAPENHEANQVEEGATLTNASGLTAAGSEREARNATTGPGPEVDNSDPATEGGAQAPAETEPDEATTLLELYKALAPLATAVLAPEVQILCPPSPLQLGRPWIAWLLQRGVRNVELTTSLLRLAAQRNVRDYMNDWEDILLELGLAPEADMDMNTGLTEDTQGFLQWLEAEMWDDYVDRAEAAAGWESTQVQALREQANMPQETRTSWTNRAAAREYQVPPAQTTAHAVEEDTDFHSLMERDRMQNAGKKKAGQEEIGAEGTYEISDRAQDHPRKVHHGGPATHAATTGGLPAPASSSDAPRANERPNLALDEACALWLFHLGLRSTVNPRDVTRALDPDTREPREEWIRSLRSPDLPAIMAGLMRVLALLMVETSELLLTHQHYLHLEIAVDAEEEDDEVLYMQRWTQGKGDKRVRLADGSTDGRGPTDEEIAEADEEERQRVRICTWDLEQGRKCSSLQWWTVVRYLLANLLDYDDVLVWQMQWGTSDQGTEVSTDEGTLTTGVNYVGKGGNLYETGYEFHGSALVVSKLLGATYLWDKVRVSGGAYGGLCRFDPRSGDFKYLSYRDPNLGKTLEAYDGAPAFLKDLDLGEDELTKAIIGCMGDIDAYLLPD